jgi:ubiquinone/menaquinone biosynthesis C-methylase UbiE
MSQQSFAAEHYAPRADAYVTSTDHSRGDDLAQIEARLRGAGIGRVLDLGCGGGHVSYCAAPHVGEVVACDVTETMLAAVARTAAERGLNNIKVEQAAAERLPFPDASFDAVLSRYTAHHWQNFGAGLREARRVLKPSGLAIFADSVAPQESVLHTHIEAIELLRDASHVRNYTIAEWVTALAQAGFGLRSVTPRDIHLQFGPWITRTGASSLHADAIRSLQTGAPAAVRDHFAIEADGSFRLDTVTIEAVAA